MLYPACIRHSQLQHIQVTVQNCQFWNKFRVQEEPQRSLPHQMPFHISQIISAVKTPLDRLQCILSPQYSKYCGDFTAGNKREVRKSEGKIMRGKEVKGREGRGGKRQ